MIPSDKTRAGYRIMSKQFVYVLRNHDSPPQYYTGLASDAQSPSSGT